MLAVSVGAWRFGPSQAMGPEVEPDQSEKVDMPIFAAGRKANDLLRIQRSHAAERGSQSQVLEPFDTEGGITLAEVGMDHDFPTASFCGWIPTSP
jgi:hypothetical protein